MRFSLLHATYRAGTNAIAVRDAWMSSAARPDRVEHIFASDIDDEISQAVPEIAAGVVSPAVPHVTAVRNWNAAAAAATGELLVVIADDLWPSDGWDAGLDGVLRDLDPLRTPFVLHASHTGQPWHGNIAHPIISRRFYEKWGLWHPEYHGYVVDIDFTLTAHRRGLVVEGRSVRFYHHSEDTESHERIPTSQPQGAAIYNRRWPMRKRHLLRRYYTPPPGKVTMSEARIAARGLTNAGVGYAKAVVPERVRRALRPRA